MTLRIKIGKRKMLILPGQISSAQHVLALWTTRHPGGGALGTSGQTLSLHTTAEFLQAHRRHGSSVGMVSPA